MRCGALLGHSSEALNTAKNMIVKATPESVATCFVNRLVMHSANRMIVIKPSPRGTCSLPILRFNGTGTPVRPAPSNEGELKPDDQIQNGMGRAETPMTMAEPVGGESHPRRPSSIRHSSRRQRC